MSLEDVNRIGVKLRKLAKKQPAEQIGAVDLLRMLKRTNISTQVLEESHIGMIVNVFRKKTSNDKIVSLCKDLLRQWKTCLGIVDTSSNTDSLSIFDPISECEFPIDSVDAEISPDTQLTDETQKNKQNDFKNKSKSRSPASSSSEDENESISIKDPCRLKSRSLIISSFKKFEIDSTTSVDVEKLSCDIEKSVYNNHGCVDTKYRACIRSRISNLRDLNNPKLRENILTNVITPQQFAKMTTMEMASDEMKKLRARFTKESIDDHQTSVQMGTETDLLKCGKCKGRKCTYNQIQTRSADEPMTTFCFCMECGNRWKFC